MGVAAEGAEPRDRRRCAFGRAISRRLVAGAIAACLGVASALHAAAASPIVVVWTGHPEAMVTATHITPQVWVEADAWARSAYPGYPLSFWQDRGGVALRAAEGKSRRFDTAEQYAASWTRAALLGYPGIAIDEFGSGDPVLDDAMADALVSTREAVPAAYIAVWHAGQLTETLAAAYRKAADLVMLETYVGDLGAFARAATSKLARARSFGIAGKCIFALGVNDLRPGAYAVPWISSADQAERQLKWLAANDPEAPGVALFAPLGSDALMHAIDLAVGRVLRPGT